MKTTTIPALRTNATIILSGERGSYTVEKQGQGGWIIKDGFTSKRAALEWARKMVGPLNTARAI